jgi:dTDP-4-dehydrorhamnose reductase
MPDEIRYTVAVTGMNGQLGKELALLAGQYPRFRFLFLSRETFPLDDPEKMGGYLNRHPVEYLINCAAYTGVDKAESDRENVFKINGEAPGIIARLLSENGGKLIQISTDYVFDGYSSKPLTEDAVTHPVNLYGDNFVRTMIRLMKTRESIQVVSDQKGSPTYAADLAKAILDILSAEKFIPGIYHYSNEGETSWYGFAQEIKKITGSSCSVSPVESSGYPTAAKRPAYSLLDKSKIKKDYKLTIPGWKTSLAICLDDMLKAEV